MSTPFSFIRWGECFSSGYDQYCQELWELAEFCPGIYPSRTPFHRLPWSSVPRGRDGDEYFEPGYVSVWALLSPDVEGYFDFEDPSCEWEPLDSPPFWDDLGFSYFHNLAESATVVGSQPVRDVMTKFSTPQGVSGYTAIAHLATFEEHVIEACAAKSIEQISGIYCAFDFAYSGRPVFDRFCFGLVQYLGAFPYSE